MIIEHTSIKFTKGVDIELTRRERKELGSFEGRKIINQLAFSSAGSKQPKSKIQTPANRGQIENQTFRELLSKRDRYKQSSSKMENKHTKRHVEDNRSDKNCHPTVNKSYSKEKSKSKSKGLSKSKSLKHLGKKSKSMIRLQAKQKKENHQQKYQKQQRKSESPQKHIKSTISLADKKNYKSNYNSKTTRELVSQLTTDRDKSKGKIKNTQASKPFKKIKKPIEDGKKKTSGKIVSEKKKVEKQKEVGKNQNKLKPKNKQVKDKKVIISQQTSKIKRNEEYEEENSQNQDEFLDSKQKRNAQKINKQSNIVQIPKRKERLSLNSNNKRYFQNKAIKTQVQIEQQLSKIKQRQNYAAIMIQKVYRGHLTRKYIRQCLQHNAAINIQRVWKGYITRKRYSQFLEKKSLIQFENIQQQQQEEAENLSKRQTGIKVFEQEQYLLQKSSSKEGSIKNIYKNQNLASIFEQILSQESVNTNLKKKIETFLENQLKQMNEFDFRSNNSARSHISNQIITNEYNSQKHFMQNFIEQEKRKKQSPNMNVFISPKSYKSPKRGGFNSPQTYNIGSPSYIFPERFDQSRQLTSSQMLLSYLRNIQNFHKQRLHVQATTDREQLNKLLLKNQLSPRTHQKRYKQVQESLDIQLTKFNESINDIVKNYMLYKESPDVSRQYEKGKPNQGAILDDQMITPKKQLVQLDIPFDMPEECINSQKLQQYNGEQSRKIEQSSQQFCQYYKFQKEQLRKDQQFSGFDTSYQFVEQYLINLSDFVIHYQDKSQTNRIVSQLKKPRSHSAQTILSNMKIVTETSEQQQQQLENSFKLPMYKYIDLDETILDSNIIQQFNSTFHRFHLNQIQKKNQLQTIFVKMIIQCMNQALNSMRPTTFLFTETRIRTIYEQRNCMVVPNLENFQILQQQSLLQIMFAQAMRKIFNYNKPQMGKQANLKYEEQGDNFQALFDSLDNKDHTEIRQQVAKEDWIFYEQMIEVVGAITQQLFEIIIFQEIAQMWKALMRAHSVSRGKDIQHHITISTNNNPFNC